MTPRANPNFPLNLDISPSISTDRSSDLEGAGFLDQESSIRDFGIAGKIWYRSQVRRRSLSTADIIYILIGNRRTFWTSTFAPRMAWSTIHHALC